MTLRHSLHENRSFIFENNVFYQSKYECSKNFENTYVKLRRKEGRLHDDETLKILPEIHDHALNEWLLRKASLKKLIEHLNDKKNRLILEVGCGNGWLSHKLATALEIEICGIDVNEIELLQGARAFGDLENVSFVYGDIFTVNFTGLKFDAIVLASSIQYFSNVKLLLQRLLELLTPLGEILIIDSSFYPSLFEADQARKRSYAYFQSLGSSEMNEHYFHHTVDELKGFNCKILYNPASIFTLMQRKLFRNTLPAFPFIQIKRS
jgi:SAM-dependent methyltransferase